MLAILPKDLEEAIHVLVGIAALLLGIMHWIIGLRWLDDKVSEIILITLGLLLMASYASSHKRRENVRNLGNKIDAIGEKIDAAGNIEIIGNPDELYVAAEKLIYEAPAGTVFYTTDLRISERTNSENTRQLEYLRKSIARMQTRSSPGHYHRAIMTTDRIVSNIREQCEIILESSVGSIESFDTNPLNVDLLIGADRVLIAIPVQEQLRYAIIVKGREVTQAFRDWYNQTIMNRGKKVTLEMLK